MYQAVDRLRQSDYLSYWDGNTVTPRPVTVVATGKAPYDLISNNTGRRDIFYDAPLADLSESRAGSMYSPATSYYASTSFKKSIGTPVAGKLSQDQIGRLRAQIAGAKKAGLKSRYWDTPAWPTSLRNHLWQVLLDEGADVLNVDDLGAAAFADWSVVQHRMFNA